MPGLRELQDGELLERLAKGDKSAFDVIYFRYSPAIYHTALRFLKDDMRSADLVQEIFTKLWVDRTKFDGIQNLKAYLIAMSRNLAIKSLKEIAAEALSRKEWAMRSNLHSENKMEDHFTNVELEKRLGETIALLPPQQRKVYYLARVEGLTYKSISDRLNISTVTVKQHMIAANRFVRERISRSGDF